MLKLYKKKDNLWSQIPNRFVVSIPNLLASGRVLDLGAGEGKNSVFLAEKGFNVTSVDISQDAIAKTLKLAKEKKVDLKGIVGDITKFKPEGQYEVIITTATLHLLKEKNALAAIQRMKMWTKIDGINLITVFTTKDPGFFSHPHLYFFKENELKQLYFDWEIIEYSVYSKAEAHNAPHTHHMTAIIAKKI
ncbi:MAG TPA: methyltransferase domain-containing protein [bacterium]|nr:methyltransferase domain-containing protein [bacterium]